MSFHQTIIEHLAHNPSKRVLTEIHGLPHYKRTRHYVIAEEPFTIENGSLTANQKFRRQAMESHFSHTVEEMYS